MTTARVPILVEKGSVATELPLALGVLRIANRLRDSPCFDIRICTSSDVDLIDSLDGALTVRAAPFLLDQAGPPDHVLVLGGSSIHNTLARLRAGLRWLEGTGNQSVLLADVASERKRLRRGKVKVERTDMSVAGIAIACGFNDCSGRARMSFREFGTAPTRSRRQLVADVSRAPKLHREEGIHNAPVTFPALASGASAHTAGTDGASVQGDWS